MTKHVDILKMHCFVKKFFSIYGHTREIMIKLQMGHQIIIISIMEQSS